MDFFKHKENDEHLFKEFFLKYNRIVFLFISRKIGDRDDVMDVTQNVFIHLWKYRKVLNDENIERIVFKTCNQEISSFFRGRRGDYQDSFDLNTISDKSQEDAEERILKEKRISELYNKIELLPDKRKKIFVLNKIDKFTHEQIAIELNISKAAVSKQVGKAMLFLKQKLN